MKNLPKDPLVRWLIMLCLLVSVGIPVLVAIVLALTE
jgi:hypothetical protein